MLSIIEFTERNRICRSKVYHEIKAGRLIAVKVGSRTLITYEAEQAWRDNLPPLVPSPPTQPDVTMPVASTPDSVSPPARGKRGLLVARCHACGRDLLKKEG